MLLGAMPSSTDDHSPLQIRCPSCGQRFKVGADLRDRTVECGSCEHRFRISDEVIQRVKKVYPGERRDAGLARFQRVPLASSMPSNVQTVSYMEEPSPAMLEPASPQRVIAGVVAGVGMALMALLLIFGAVRGGTLDGMSTLNRQLMAAFAAVVATVLLVYANPRARIKAGMFALLGGVGLLSLPIVFDEASTPLAPASSGSVSGTADPDRPALADDEPDEITMLRETIGTAPLEQEQKRLEEAQSGKKVFGLWLRDLRESNKLLVRDYLLRSTGADPSSHPYPRENSDYLMVVTGIDLSLNELSMMATRFGTTVMIYEEIGVAEVKVNNDVFIESPLDKLTNKEDPAYYDLNKRELESIDPERVSRAVARLAESEPKIYRADITGRMIELMRESGLDFKGSLCKALLVWAEDLTKAADVVAGEVEKLHEMRAAIPKEMFELLAKAGHTRTLPILDAKWAIDTSEWTDVYAAFGPAVEPLVIKRFPETGGVLRRSAVTLLRRVGGEASIPVLEAAKEAALSGPQDAELRVQIDRALEAVRKRAGR
jgi:hypothetical protein